MRKGMQPHHSSSDDFRYFTDRETETGEILAVTDKRDGEPLPMILVDGPGGTGKSWLARKVAEGFRARDIPTVTVDFRRESGPNVVTQDSSLALLAIARGLVTACPRFELAFAAKIRGLGLAAASAGDQPSSAIGWLGPAAADLLSLVPLLGTPIKVAALTNVAGKAVASVARRASSSDGEKVIREWLGSADGKEFMQCLEATAVDKIDDDLCRFLARDLLEMLPRRAGRACRAVVILDSWEEQQGSELESAQRFDHRERWLVDLHGACHAADGRGKFAPFVQFVVLGRDRACWDLYDSDLQDQEMVRCIQLLGLREPDARSYLKRRSVENSDLQAAILREAIDQPGAKGEPVPTYHPLALGLAADTVEALRYAFSEPTAADFRLPPGEWSRMAERFLRSVGGGTATRLRRLALTPRFDEPALQYLCGPGPTEQVDAVCDRIRSFSFVDALGGGWYAMHNVLRRALLEVPDPTIGPRAAKYHEDWLVYWSERATGPGDPCAALGWYHRWRTKPEDALKSWSAMAEAARVRLAMAEHLELIAWWTMTGLEDRAPGGTAEAAALVSLGGELARATLGDTAANLRRAVAAYARALEVRKREATPRDRAMAQNNLGNALQTQALLSPVGAGNDLLAQAVAAYRSALEVYTREGTPHGWAVIQNNLAAAFREQALRSPADAARDLLARAVAAYGRALEVYTRETTPQAWAMTQKNLGNALREQAVRSPADAGNDLLAHAVAAYGLALEVYTRVGAPQDWARAQNNLGTSLQEQALRSPADAAIGLLARAVAAYGLALEVYTRDGTPLDWAMTQNNLGNTLREQAVRSPADAASELLARAVAAYGRALEVFTRDGAPQYWAMTQNNLGNALRDQAVRSPTDAARDLLAQAVAAFRGALDVYTWEATPQDWAGAQNNLGNALQTQAVGSPADAASDLPAQAVAAYRGALEVYTRDGAPWDWAMTQYNLGNALAAQALLSPAGAARDPLAQAVAAYRGALEVYTREDAPQFFDIVSGNVSGAECLLKHLEAGEWPPPG